MTGESFDAYYYANCCGRPYARDEHWQAFFGRIADHIVSEIGPRTVMDAGCAMGLLVEALRARGVEAWGIDISQYAIERVHESVREFCRQGSIGESFTRRFDLVVCIEVLEHMPRDEADQAVANFVAHTGDVLFSSSPHDYREPTHVNVRPPEDWAEQFARHGFFRDVEFDASVIAAWAVRFRKSSEPFHRIVRQFERRLARLEQERHDMRAFTAEAQNRQVAAEDRRAHVEHMLSAAIEDARRFTAEAQNRQAAVEDHRAHEQMLNAAVEDTRRQLHDAIRKAEQQEDRAKSLEEIIRNMEQSFFWKIRKLLRR
jgi:SAM-dependent methyltransferase